jgi:hypothetical protein
VGAAVKALEGLSNLHPYGVLALAKCRPQKYMKRSATDEKKSRSELDIRFAATEAGASRIRLLLW